MGKELEGYDYEELIDKWGLRKKYKKLYKATGVLNDLNIVNDDEMFRMHDDLGVRLLTEYIGNAVTHDSAGNTFIDEDVLGDMLTFLQKLRNHSAVSPGDAQMYRSIADLQSNPESMFEFYRWFVHCLPLMWN